MKSITQHEYDALEDNKDDALKDVEVDDVVDDARDYVKEDDKEDDKENDKYDDKEENNEDVVDDATEDVMDDAKEDSKEDDKEEYKEEDIECYRNLDHDKDGDREQYMTEILEGPIIRIDRPHSTDVESQEAYGNHKSKFCQSISKHTFNIISGIFISISATAIWTVVGIYFVTNSDNTTNIETTTLNKGGDQNLTIFIVSDLANSNAIKTTTLTKAQGIP